MNPLFIINATATLQLSIIIASVGIAISCFEDLLSPVHFKDNGILSWNISRLREKWTTLGPISNILNIFLSWSRYRFILMSMFVASMFIPIMLLLKQPIFIPFLCFVVLAGLIFHHIRNMYGLNGSDHMNLIILSAVIIGISLLMNL